MEEEFSRVVSDIRQASRDLVRQFGLTRQTVAGTDLSISGVHAIMEIGRNSGLSSKALGEILVLEKSTISRLVGSLVKKGEVVETRSDRDARVKCLKLTAKGLTTWAKIEKFAECQVSTALKQVPTASQKSILRGLTVYASALAETKSETITTATIIPPKIHTGYAPQLIGNIVTTLHRHMNRQYGFGRQFEARIASDLCEFITRIEKPQNQIWWAQNGGRFLGSISIDSHFIDDGFAHLRWFIVDEHSRGQGVGQSLLQNALSFCDDHKFKETHLWTVKGLESARKLYEKSGFILAEEYAGDQWGSLVTEQKFVRPHPSVLQ